jgi:hypothetical protein
MYIYIYIYILFYLLFYILCYLLLHLYFTFDFTFYCTFYFTLYVTFYRTSRPSCETGRGVEYQLEVWEAASHAATEEASSVTEGGQAGASLRGMACVFPSFFALSFFPLRERAGLPRGSFAAGALTPSHISRPRCSNHWVLFSFSEHCAACHGLSRSAVGLLCRLERLYSCRPRGSPLGSFFWAFTEAPDPAC